MTFKEFVDKKRAEVDEFESEWVHLQAAEGMGQFPNEMSEEDWEEQFITITEMNGH